MGETGTSRIVAPQLRQRDRAPETPLVRHIRPLTLAQCQRRLVALDRRQPGIAPPRALAGLEQPLGRARVARLLPVVGDDVGIRPWLPQHGQQRLADLPVDAATPRRREPLVQRLADERVREADAHPIRCLHQQPGLRRLLDYPSKAPSPTRATAAVCQHDLLANHRREGEEPRRLRAESRHPPVDDLSQQRRHAHPRQVAQRPTSALGPRDAFLFQVAE